MNQMQMVLNYIQIQIQEITHEITLKVAHVPDEVTVIQYETFFIFCLFFCFFFEEWIQKYSVPVHVNQCTSQCTSTLASNPNIQSTVIFLLHIINPYRLCTAVLQSSCNQLSHSWFWVLANYRPMSNLPCLSKTLEKVLAKKVVWHLYRTSLFKVFQSSFTIHYRMETVLVKLQITF